MMTPLAELDQIIVRTSRGDTILGPLAVALEPATIGIIGRSGAGKSTLLRLLTGRLPAHWEQRGQLWCRGLRVPPGDRVPGTVAVLQEAQSGLDPRARASRLLAWAAGGAPSSAVDRALTALGLDPETIRSQRAPTLSGGMRHRLLIAMALLRAERLLLLDEPTSALDARNAQRVLAAATAWRTRDPAARAVLVASHDLQLLLDHVDWLWVLDGGRLVEVVATPVTAADLRSRPARAHVAALARLGEVG